MYNLIKQDTLIIFAVLSDKSSNIYTVRFFDELVKRCNPSKTLKAKSVQAMLRMYNFCTDEQTKIFGNVHWIKLTGIYNIT